MNLPPTAVPITILRADLPSLAFGVVDATAGLLACVVFALRRRQPSWPLLLFGVSAFLYGTRLFMQTGTASYLLPSGLIRWTVWTVTGFVPLTFTLFIVCILFAVSRRTMLWITLVLGAQGAAYTLAHLYPPWIPLAEAANNTVVLIAMPVLLVLVFLRSRAQRREVLVLRIGIACFMVFAAYTNAVNLGFLRGSSNLEYIGFTELIACFGYVAAHRTIATEDRLEVISRELALAQQIQSRLLPAGVSIPGIVIATRYVPSAYVAGDFYDFLPHGDNAMGVLIADVAGHGVPAALTASMVKIAAQSQAGNAAQPAAVLAGMNRALYGNVDVNFVTAGYVFLDVAMSELRYSAAGHPPMILWRAATRTVECVEENGLFLGAFADAIYQFRSLPVETGDRCLLYTDGVTEAPSRSGEEFGATRLAAFLAENIALPAAQFCDALVTAIAAWSDRRDALQQHDDITIVIVDWTRTPLAPAPPLY